MIDLIYSIQVWKTLKEFRLKSSLEELKKKRDVNSPKYKSQGEKANATKIPKLAPQKKKKKKKKKDRSNTSI